MATVSRQSTLAVGYKVVTTAKSNGSIQQSSRRCSNCNKLGYTLKKTAVAGESPFGFRADLMYGIDGTRHSSLSVTIRVSGISKMASITEFSLGRFHNCTLNCAIG